MDYFDLNYFDHFDLNNGSFNQISNIGGNLGLFVGISFLSFAEIIELLLETIYILFERKRLK